MSIRGDGIRTDTFQWWVAHLLLLAVFSRALVPVGFMPSFSAADGVFKVVVCSAYGAKTIVLKLDGTPEPDQQASHLDQPCAFAGLVFFALPALEGAPLDPQEFGSSVLALPLAEQLPPSRAGPSLGSRGPPQIS